MRVYIVTVDFPNPQEREERLSIIQAQIAQGFLSHLRLMEHCWAVAVRDSDNCTTVDALIRHGLSDYDRSLVIPLGEDCTDWYSRGYTSLSDWLGSIGLRTSAPPHNDIG